MAPTEPVAPPAEERDESDAASTGAEAAAVPHVTEDAEGQGRNGTGGRPLLAFGLAVATLLVVDATLHGAVRWAEALSLPGLGLLVGGMVGLPAAALHVLFRRRQRPLAMCLAWAALGLVAAAALASTVDAFDKIGGRYDHFAVAVLVVSGAAGLSMAMLGIATHPWGPDGTSWLEGRSWTLRVALAAPLVATTAVVLRFEPEMLLLYAYPLARVAIRLGSWCTAAMALLVLWPRLTPNRRNQWVLGVVGASLLGGVGYLASASGVATARVRGVPQAQVAIDLLRRLTDLDGDGHSGFFGGGDCDGLDPEVGPGRREIPGNGLDDNCVLGDASVDATPAVLPVTPATTPPPDVNLVLITIDSLRPDHMSAYGYDRETTPQIAQWARGARRFDHAYSSSAWTSLSLSSLMRGVLPRELLLSLVFEVSSGSSIVDNNRLVTAPIGNQLRPGERIRAAFTLPQTDPHPTLATYLSARGLHTAAVVDDGYSDFLQPAMGNAGGFDSYEVIPYDSRKGADDAALADHALTTMERMDGAPFFLWLHFFGPHAPDQQHHDTPEFGDDARGQYDHEIAYMDRHVGRVLAGIDELSRPTLVIVTSDHGELFSPSRFGGRAHGIDLSCPSVYVPFFVRGPGFEPGVSDVVVSHLDIVPTFLEAAGVAAPGYLGGESLRTASAGRIVGADLWRIDLSARVVPDLMSVTDGQTRLVFDRLAGQTYVSSEAGCTRPRTAGPLEGQAPALEHALQEQIEARGGPIRLAM